MSERMAPGSARPREHALEYESASLLDLLCVSGPPLLHSGTPPPHWGIPRGSGCRLPSGAAGHPALPAGGGTEAPLPRVLNRRFQHAESGPGVLREGGLSHLHSTVRGDLPADRVPRLALR